MSVEKNTSLMWKQSYHTDMIMVRIFGLLSITNY